MSKRKFLDEIYLKPYALALLSSLRKAEEVRASKRTVAKTVESQSSEDRAQWVFRKQPKLSPRKYL